MNLCRTPPLPPPVIKICEWGPWGLTSQMEAPWGTERGLTKGECSVHQGGLALWSSQRGMEQGCLFY